MTSPVLQPKPYWRSRFRWAAGSCAFLLGAAGCSSPKPPPLDTDRLRQFEARAYPAQHQYDTVQSEELRLAEGTPMRLVWLRPQAPGPHPLVVYMPGAGQDARAFTPWRQTLAQAGYVVLSWQPLPDDDLLPGSSGVPKADLHTWAAQRFDTANLQRRIDLLARLMAELSRAAAAQEPALQGVDLGHVALAGYELGAWTTMLAAGEHVRGVTDGVTTGSFKAFIVISPHASFEQGGFDSRYRDLRGPLLTITSDADTDPYALGAAAYLRAAPFAGMPAGEKALLVLRGISHADLGGRVGPERIQQQATPAEGEQPARRAPARSDGPPSGGPGGGTGGGRRGGQQGADRASGERSAAGQDRYGGGGAQSPSPTLQAMQVSAMRTVGVAFLDAYLQDDALARGWMGGPSEKWLTPMADWRRK